MSEEMKQETSSAVEAPKPETPITPKRTFDAKDIEANKYVAALSYLGILFLVPLFMKQESPFAQFHAKQGLVLMIVCVVGSFVFWIPLIGWALAIAWLVVDVMALFRTLSGETWKIPCVKDAVKKLNV